jgi:hypothetical protein
MLFAVCLYVAHKVKRRVCVCSVLEGIVVTVNAACFLTLIHFCKDWFIYRFLANLVIAKCDKHNRLVCVMDKQHVCM